MSGSEVKINAGSKTIKQELGKGQLDNIWLIHEILSPKFAAGPTSRHMTTKKLLAFANYNDNNNNDEIVFMMSMMRLWCN